MSSSVRITASVPDIEHKLEFKTMPEVLPYAKKINQLSVEITGFQFTHQSFQSFLLAVMDMPKLRSLALSILPGGLPHSDLIYEYYPSRGQFPALMSLSLSGIGLKCTSLGNLCTLELRNYPGQPTMTFDDLLVLLAGSSLLRLTLDNYLSMADNGLPARSIDRIGRLGELHIRDTPQRITRLLHHLPRLPHAHTTICALYGKTRFDQKPRDFNPFVAMVPSRPDDLPYPVFTGNRFARLELFKDTVRLVCHAEEGFLVLEVNSTLREHTSTHPAIYDASYSAVVAAAGDILKHSRKLTMLKVTDAPVRVERRALVKVLRGVEGLTVLTISDDAGPGYTARALLEAIASPPERGQEVLHDNRVACPRLVRLELEKVIPGIMDSVLDAVRGRDNLGSRLNKLVVGVQAQQLPKGKDRYGQPTDDFVGASGTGWEGKLLAHVNSVSVV